MAITIGIPSTSFFYPVADRLNASGLVKVVPGSSPDIARQLRERQVDAAIISPIDFGRECSEYFVIRNGMVVSSSSTNTITLHFQSSLHTISTIAVQPAAVSEIVLTRILLAEEFDLTPSFVPMEGSLSEMLGRADGALLTGGASLMADHENRLDLVEAWNELTGLPLVHGILCTRENSIPETQLSAIASVLISASVPEGDPESIRYRSSFDCKSDDEAVQALREFLHYAYYHGILPDVGEIRILPIQESGEQVSFSTN